MPLLMLIQWCQSSEWQFTGLQLTDILILLQFPQSDWRRSTGRPQHSWMATAENDLSSSKLGVAEATELVLNKPLWRPLTASRAMHWNGARRRNYDDLQTTTRLVSLLQ